MQIPVAGYYPFPTPSITSRSSLPFAPQPFVPPSISPSKSNRLQEYRYWGGSLMIFSNSCSQAGSWHRNSSTFTGERVFSIGRLRSGISSNSSLICRSIAVPPHFGQTSIMSLSFLEIVEATYVPKKTPYSSGAVRTGPLEARTVSGVGPGVNVLFILPHDASRCCRVRRSGWCLCPESVPVC